MRLKIGILLILTLQASQSLAGPSECKSVASVLACLGNQTVEVGVQLDNLKCQVTPASRPRVRDDYSYTPGIGYHKLHNVAQKWNDARKICLLEDARLAVINSTAEEQVILDMLHREVEFIRNAARTDMVWLGGHNMFAANEWVTSEDGKSLSSSGYVNWSKGCDGYPPEPNNSNGNEHCLSLYGKCQGWNDYDCEYKLAFVCEKPDVCA